MGKRQRSDLRSVEERARQLDAVVNAIAHADRRLILLGLKMRGGSMTSGEIASRYSCAWPTITRHLRVLEKAGLIVRRKRGRHVLYELDIERLKQTVGDWVGYF